MWQALAGLAGAALGAIGQRNANRENRLMQEKFASSGIRMRVEDAKAAGLHPLFALGANVPGYSPSAQSVFDGASLGQNLSRAASQFSSEERELRRWQLEAIKAGATADYAKAAAYASEAARAKQEQEVSKPVVQSFPVGPDFDSRTEINGELVQHAGTRFYEMGPPPGAAHPYIVNPTGSAAQSFKRWGMPVVGEIIAPDAQNFSESLEGVENFLTASAVAAANLAHYGPEKFKVISAWVQRQVDSISERASANWRRAVQELIPFRGR